MRRNAVSQPAALPPNGPAADSATRLLADYAAGSPFFFASPQGTLLAQEAFATVPEAAAGASPATLAQRVSRSLDEARKAGHPDPVAVGAVPFDLSAPARLMVARNLRSADRLSLRSAEFRYAAEYDKTLGLDRLMYRAAGSAETRREDLRRGNAGSAEACLIPMRAGPLLRGIDDGARTGPALPHDQSRHSVFLRYRHTAPHC